MKRWVHGVAWATVLVAVVGMLIAAGLNGAKQYSHGQYMQVEGVPIILSGSSTNLGIGISPVAPINILVDDTYRLSGTSAQAQSDCQPLPEDALQSREACPQCLTSPHSENWYPADSKVMLFSEYRYIVHRDNYTKGIAPDFCAKLFGNPYSKAVFHNSWWKSFSACGVTSEDWETTHPVTDQLGFACSSDDSNMYDYCPVIADAESMPCDTTPETCGIPQLYIVDNVAKADLADAPPNILTSDCLLVGVPYPEMTYSVLDVTGIAHTNVTIYGPSDADPTSLIVDIPNSTFYKPLKECNFVVFTITWDIQASLTCLEGKEPIVSLVTAAVGCYSIEFCKDALGTSMQEPTATRRVDAPVPVIMTSFAFGLAALTANTTLPTISNTTNTTIAPTTTPVFEADDFVDFYRQLARSGVRLHIRTSEFCGKHLIPSPTDIQVTFSDTLKAGTIVGEVGTVVDGIIAECKTIINTFVTQQFLDGPSIRLKLGTLTVPVMVIPDNTASSPTYLETHFHFIGGDKSDVRVLYIKVDTGNWQSFSTPNVYASPIQSFKLNISMSGTPFRILFMLDTTVHPCTLTDIKLVFYEYDESCHACSALPPTPQPTVSNWQDILFALPSGGTSSTWTFKGSAPSLDTCNQRNDIRAFADNPLSHSKQPLEWTFTAEFGHAAGYNPSSNRWTIATTTNKRNVWSLWSPQIGVSHSLRIGTTLIPSIPTPGSYYFNYTYFLRFQGGDCQAPGYAYLNPADFNFQWTAPANDKNELNCFENQCWPYGAWRTAWTVINNDHGDGCCGPNIVYAPRYSPGKRYYSSIAPPIELEPADNPKMPTKTLNQRVNTTSFYHYVVVDPFVMEDFPVCSVSIRPRLPNTNKGQWNALREKIQAAALLGYTNYEYSENYGQTTTLNPNYGGINWASGTILNTWTTKMGFFSPDVRTLDQPTFIPADEEASCDYSPYTWKTSPDVSKWIYYHLLDHIELQIEDIFLVDEISMTRPSTSTNNYTMVENGPHSLGDENAFPFATARSTEKSASLTQSTTKNTFAIKYTIDWTKLLDPKLAIYWGNWERPHDDHIRDRQWLYLYQHARARVVSTVNAVATQLAGLMFDGAGNTSDPNYISTMEYDVIYNKFQCEGGFNAPIDEFYTESASQTVIPSWPTTEIRSNFKEMGCGVCFDRMMWNLNDNKVSFYTTIEPTPTESTITDPIYSITATPTINPSASPIHFNIKRIYAGEPPSVSCTLNNPTWCEPKGKSGFGNQLQSKMMDSSEAASSSSCTASAPVTLFTTNQPALKWTIEFVVYNLSIPTYSSSSWTFSYAHDLATSLDLYTTRQALMGAIESITIVYNDPISSTFKPLKATLPYGPENSLHGGTSSHATFEHAAYFGPAATHMIINGELLVPQTITIHNVKARVVSNRTTFTRALGGTDPIDCICPHYIAQTVHLYPRKETNIPNPIPVQYNLGNHAPNFAISSVYTIGPVLPEDGYYKPVVVRYIENTHPTYFGVGSKRLSLINPTVVAQALKVSLNSDSLPHLSMNSELGVSMNNPTDAISSKALLLTAAGVNVLTVLTSGISIGDTVDIWFEPPDVPFDDQPFPLQVLQEMPTCNYSWSVDSTTYTAGPTQVGSFPTATYSEHCDAHLCDPCTSDQSGTIIVGKPATTSDSKWKDMPTNTRGWGMETTLPGSMFYITMWVNPGMKTDKRPIIYIRATPPNITAECPSLLSNLTIPTIYPHFTETVGGQKPTSPGEYTFTWANDDSSSTHIRVYHLSYCNDYPCQPRTPAWKIVPSSSSIFCTSNCDDPQQYSPERSFKICEPTTPNIVITCTGVSAPYTTNLMGTAQILHHFPS